MHNSNCRHQAEQQLHPAHLERVRTTKTAAAPLHTFAYVANLRRLPCYEPLALFRGGRVPEVRSHQESLSNCSVLFHALEDESGTMATRCTQQVAGCRRLGKMCQCVTVSLSRD